VVLGTGRFVVAVGLVVLAVVWVLTNKPYEGGILVSFDRTHGLTFADLLSVAAVLAAIRLAWPARR